MSIVSASNAGVIKIARLEGMGGNTFQGHHMSKYFNMNDAHNFGLQVPRLWMSESIYYPKTLLSLTAYSGNVCMSAQPMYRWKVGTDVNRKVRIMEDVTILNTGGNIVNGRIGHSMKEFWLVLENDYCRKNGILQLESPDWLLVVASDPQPHGQYFKYKVRVQGSDVNRACPVALLQQAKYVTENGSSVETYGTPAKPGTQMDTNFELMNIIGAYGRQFSIDERAIRQCLQHKKYGQSLQDNIAAQDIVDGQAWHFTLKTKDPKTGQIQNVKASGFISLLEMKIEQELERDIEFMCKFGKYEDSSQFNGSNSQVSQMTDRRVAPGVRELFKDGHYLVHSGNITLSQLEEWYLGIAHTRIDETDRKLTLITGSLGRILFDKMISIVHQGVFGSNIVLDANKFTREASSRPNGNEIAYGFQWTQYQGKNGVEINLAFDKMLDDPTYCERRYQPNGIYTVDSARMEVYDFGKSGVAMTNLKGQASNVCMMVEDFVEEHRWVYDAYNPYTGAVRQSVGNNKDAQYHARRSGSVNFWDTSRCGAVVFEPEMLYS